MSALEMHFAALDGKDDKTEEDVVQTLLGVIGYAAQTLRLHPDSTQTVIRHLRSESLRIKSKLL